MAVGRVGPLSLLDTTDDDNDTMSTVSNNDDARPNTIQTSRSPYLHPTHQATASTSTFNSPPPASSSSTPTPTTPGTPRVAASRKPSSLRHVANAPADPPQAIKRHPSSPSTRDTKPNRALREREPRPRNTPRLPHSDDVPITPATHMYWSRAPVHGTVPNRNMRAHTVTLVDNVAWLFGGCDDKGCWKDIYCFDTDTMQWSHPEALGQVPPPCRAHTATLVDRKIVIFGGGEGPTYYDSTYILDTTTRRWYAPIFPGQSEDEQPPPPPPTDDDEDPVHPAPRRAHTAVLYNGKIYVFGGGNGLTALNDLWTLDVSRLDTSLRGIASGSLKWTLVKTKEPPPPRGYHTANLVGNVMVIVGGSDGCECFSDVWCLNLDSLIWTRVSPSVAHRRLSHTSTQVGSYLFIVGGHDGTTYNHDVLFYNLVNLQYEPRSVSGRPPSARGYHVTIVADSRLFMFGGFNGYDVFNDVHILDLAGAAYLPQVMSFRIDVE
ncbi:galactose oxidase [Chiua virens]|nr:galactose oxidase [Chiua virens]